MVDDHELIRRGIDAVIEQDGTFDVCGEAVNGLEAVQKVQELRPDVVTLDVSMPGMGGLEAARQIRKIAPSTKIVIVTMHNSDWIYKEAERYGADAVVTKSDLAAKLIDIIKRLLREQSLS